MIIDGFGSEIEALVAVFGNIGAAEFVIGGRKIYHIVNDAVVKSEIHAVDIERIAIGSAVFLREEAGTTSGTVEEDLFAAEIQFSIRIKQERIGGIGGRKILCAHDFFKRIVIIDRIVDENRRQRIENHRIFRIADRAFRFEDGTRAFIYFDKTEFYILQSISVENKPAVGVQLERVFSGVIGIVGISRRIARHIVIIEQVVPVHQQEIIVRKLDGVRFRSFPRI